MRLASCLVVLAVTCSSAWAGETKIDPASLPEPVLTMLKRHYPDAEMKEATKEVEHGKLVYEVAIHDANGDREVKLKPTGEILEVERSIELSEIPERVSKALARRYAKGTPESAEEIIAGPRTIYEVVLSMPEDKRIEVRIQANGLFLGKEEADAED